MTVFKWFLFNDFFIDCHTEFICVCIYSMAPRKSATMKKKMRGGNMIGNILKIFGVNQTPTPTPQSGPESESTSRSTSESRSQSGLPSGSTPGSASIAGGKKRRSSKRKTQKRKSR